MKNRCNLNKSFEYGAFKDELYWDISFRERLHRIREGLRCPKGSGKRKYAEAELKHLISWACAFLVPLLLLGVIILMPESTGDTETTAVVKLLEPPKPPEPLIEKREEFEPEKVRDPEVKEPFTTAKVTDYARTIDRASASPAMSKVPQLADIKFIKSSISIPMPLTGRIGEKREAIVARCDDHGGEGAVLRALRWLKANQNPDGSWDAPKPAMTGLALLCYLARGEVPGSGEFGPTVRKALQWLQSNQTSSGRFRYSDKHEYSLPIAAYALSEAFAMIRNPYLQESAEKSIQVIIDGQNSSGCWDYNCRSSDRNDTSYSAWCIQALKAARIAKLRNKGLAEAMDAAVDGLKQNTHPKGGFGYTGPGRSDLTSAGVLCLQMLGQADSGLVKSSLSFLADDRCDWSKPQGKRPLYYWYYTTQATFHAGGKAWEQWDRHFGKELVSRQVILKDHTENGKATGYWESPSPEENYGKVYSTTLCTLMLEVYYRQLMLYAEPAGEPSILEDRQEENEVPVQIVIPEKCMNSSV